MTIIDVLQEQARLLGYTEKQVQDAANFAIVTNPGQYAADFRTREIPEPMLSVIRNNLKLVLQQTRNPELIAEIRKELNKP